MTPHQLFPLAALEVSEEAEAVLAEALEQQHAGRGLPVPETESRAPRSEPTSVFPVRPLPWGV